MKAFFVRPTATRTGRFRFRHAALLFARARLFADRLELSGWHWGGRYRRRIPLPRILQIDAPGPERLLLWLSNGEVVRLVIDHAADWKAAIELNRGRLEDQSASSS